MWIKGAPDHINTAAPEYGGGRLYQFVAKISFPSKKYEGRRASIVARLVAWRSGARRTEGGKPELYIGSGDPFVLITTHGQS